MWSSSNTRVVTVQSNGTIKAVGEGTATVTATAQDGGYARGNCTITVKWDLVVISKDKDYREDLYQGQCTYNKVTFTRSGKVWHCIDVDLVFDQNNHDLITNDRSNLNFYANYHINKEDDSVISTYTNDELRLLYAIDPYGVADYVQRYAAELSGGLEATIGYKDRIFEMLFGRRPKHYIRTLDGENWVEITDYNSLSAVLSESELIFGGHPLYDAHTIMEIAELVVEVAGILLGRIDGLGLVVSVATSALLYLIDDEHPSAVDAIYAYATDDKAMTELIEINWANDVLDVVNVITSLNDFFESTLVDKTCFTDTLEYCYDGTVYEVFCESNQENRYSFREINTLLREQNQ